jgi:adenine-specific DNA methylase
MSKDLYGIPYMGSKTKMARTIHRILPSGERFVDLFGGGFAMSHSALLLPKKYKSVLYNDYNTLLVNLINDALHGKYSYKNFKPEFITRQDFDRLKDSDGYVKYIWSFGNSGKNYLFAEDVEPLKHMAHDLIVFGKKSNELEKICPGINEAVKSRDIHSRRMDFCAFVRRRKNICDKEQLQQLERLQRLQQLEQLNRLEQLELSNMSYLDYEYREGDIVYCDPPYEGTADYGSSFDFQEFYDWAISRPYQIWFSSYKISDTRFKLVYAKRIRGTLAGSDGAVYNFERIYTNKE